jgi:Transcriptional regulatory protein, C terminal
VDKRELFEQIWPGVIVTDDSLVQAVKDIRNALGDDAHSVVQTVPRRGYRLISTLHPVAPETSIESGITKTDTNENAANEVVGAADVNMTTTFPETERRITVQPISTQRKFAWAALLLAAIVGLIAWQPWQSFAPVNAVKPKALTPEHPPIAVLDFGGPASPIEDQQMARAYAEELSGTLARNADMRVIASYSSFKAGAGGDSLQRIAERLGATYLVSGTLRREGEQLHL